MCPVDGARLEMSERQGVEIDYCPTCRGVWLDRGELDKIVERSDSYNEHPPFGERLSYRKKRKSFFSELFDD
jgi:Zn-finger nucleic acid-binding protein